MISTSDRNVSVLEPAESLAQAADNSLTKPAPSSEHSDEFETATSSPAEPRSEEDQEITFRIRSGSHSQEYAFKLVCSIRFHLEPL